MAIPMLVGLAAFLLLFVALLAIPVTLTFQVSWRETFESDIRLRWAFGLVRVRLPASQSKPSTAQGEEGEERTSRVNGGRRKGRNVLALARQRDFRQRIIRFIRDVWHALHKENIVLRARLGLGDPADTGRLWALVGPMSGILASARGASIRIEPEFFDDIFEVDSSGSIRVIPLQVIYLTMALLLSPPIRQGIGQMRIAKA